LPSGRVRAAQAEEQLALIRAHPELAGREAAAGTLTADSTSEQGRLGFTALTRAEFEAAHTLAPVDEHIDETHRLMSLVGAQGFPTFVLQIGEDLYPVPHARFASQPAQFRDWLEAQVKANAPAH